jgi:hypothetical protein
MIIDYVDLAVVIYCVNTSTCMSWYMVMSCSIRLLTHYFSSLIYVLVMWMTSLLFDVLIS